MDLHHITEYAREFVAFLLGGIYGTIGSLVHYIWGFVKGTETNFQWKKFFINGTLGFFIGQVIGSFIPESVEFRDGVLLLSGFLVYQILAFIEADGLKIIKKKFIDK